MLDTMRNSDSGCVPGTNCGSSIHFKSAFNFIFFLTFILLGKYCLHNLFVSVVVEEFKENYINTDNPLKNYSEDCAKFKESWAKFTIHITGQKIKETKLVDLMLDLKKPLGFEAEQKIKEMKLNNESEIIYAQNLLRKQAAKAIFKMNLCCDKDGNIYFNDLLFAVLKRTYSQYLFEEYTQEGIEIILKEEKKTLKKISNTRKIKIPNFFFFSNKTTSFEKKSFATSNHVNPLIRELFSGMIFLTWKKYTSDKELYEKSQASSLNLLKDEVLQLNSDPDDDDDDSSSSESEILSPEKEKKKPSYFNEDFNQFYTDRKKSQKSIENEGRISYNIINLNISNNVIINNNIIINSSDSLHEEQKKSK